MIHPFCRHSWRWPAPRWPLGCGRGLHLVGQLCRSRVAVGQRLRRIAPPEGAAKFRICCCSNRVRAAASLVTFQPPPAIRRFAKLPAPTERAPLHRCIGWRCRATIERRSGAWFQASESVFPAALFFAAGCRAWGAWSRFILLRPRLALVPALAGAAGGGHCATQTARPPVASKSPVFRRMYCWPGTPADCT